MSYNDPARGLPTHPTQALDFSEDVPRYTAGELASRLLRLAESHEPVEGANSAARSVCTDCLRMAIGRSACPHGCFPRDRRERPLLLYRGELLAAGVTPDQIAALVGPRPSVAAPGSSGSVGPGHSSSAYNSLRGPASPAPPVSSVSAIASSATMASGSSGVTYLPVTPTRSHSGLSSARATARQAAPAGAPAVAAAPGDPPALGYEYEPHFDQYNADIKTWYVVVAGRSVGVFGNIVDMISATSGVSKNYQFSRNNYQDAIEAFRKAQHKGEVRTRQ
ncbi:hypothetical protein DICSQDRAFT_175615 [Dichomitus squalens LYAD-421 SS1]|uniref:Uncharacterized protein n=1 Tax=Dichomitus squalens (strain LYAD-421) TaxID=732165 RepID=R7SIN6_DICSQ|nr:uncharacterized protein DICSQDRAFT_175615 [Dichomitus squalens LYAD-421 SS1]EJF55698.1 hypothetical protein DICSQDRAFT_175615 [Dichomitus squalens LYAD-421 SS1]